MSDHGRVRAPQWCNFAREAVNGHMATNDASNAAWETRLMERTLKRADRVTSCSEG